MDAIRMLVVALTLNVASAVVADSIQLRSRVMVTDPIVRLADVATLTGDDVESRGQLVILHLEASQSSTTLTQDALRTTLAKAGINWARTSLKGFEKCEISRAESTVKPTEKRDENAAIDAPASPILSNPTDEIAADAQHTIRARLTAWMRALHGSAGEEIRITFNDRDAKMLDAHALEDQLIFTSAASSNLGRVPVSIQRFRGEKLIDTQRVTLEVSQRHLAVVAAKPIAKGATLAFEDIEIREVFLDRREANLIVKIDDAVGLIAGVSVREGALILKDQIRPTLLVQRNDLVRVQAIAGGLMIQTFARALEDGGEGQMIQVRNERSREVFSVRVIGVRKALLQGDDAVPVDEKNAKKQAENKLSSAPVQGTP